MKTSNTSPNAGWDFWPAGLRPLVVAVVIAGAFADMSYAIDPHRAMSQYVRDRWGIDQGFPRGAVYAIAQTADGYLWIGTEAGLVRFDGREFRLMQNRAAALAITSVLGLATDREGSLWVRLRDMSLLRYRDGKFDNPIRQPRSLTNVTAIGTTRKGELAAGWLQNGAFTYRDGAFRALARAEGMPRSPILALAQTGDGAFWLGTRGSGLFRLRDGATSSISQGLPDPKIDCLFPEGNQTLWIGTDAGMIRWDGARLTTLGIPAALNQYQILTLTKDRDGNLWIGSDSGGLLRLNADGLSSLDKHGKEPRNAITALFEDREGNLWIGSANGIERLRDSTFVTYSVSEGLPTDGSNPVYVDAENRTWFPPIDGGLWWFRGEKHERIRLAGLENDIVYSLAGRNDELWLGRQRGGLTRLTVKGGVYSARTYTKADGLAQNSVYSVYQDRGGGIWAGTLSGGVSKLDHGAFTNYTVADGLASNTVASVLQSFSGAMWFATPIGLSSLDRGRWRTFTSAEGLPSENVNCLLEDFAHVLWAGTTSGPAFLRSGRFVTPSPLPSLLSEQILGLAEDRYGFLWMATSNHVLRVNRNKLLQGGLSEEDIREYGLADGLRGVQGVKRHRSVVTDALGRIWFSLNRGVSVVDPARLRSSSAPGIVHIQTLSADGVGLSPRDDMRVAAGSRRIVFGFAGLSFSVPERVRYRYMLEGFDRGWSEPVSEREAVYTNLSPHAYRFHVMASNPDGSWSLDEASLAFDVEPAYWQTWWFRMGAFVVCILAGIALYRLRLRQLTATLNVRFEERLAERTRIAQDLHDTLLQGFLSASMQVHVAADRLPPASAATPILNRALELMSQVIEEGRNAVRGLRSTRDASLDLEDAFLRVRDEFAPAGKPEEAVAFRVIANGQRKALHPVLRDEVYRIGREALINAFRHAKAKTIEVELNYSSSALRVLVRDDGCGIDTEALRAGRDGHWGLSGMRERADGIGARLRLWSGASAGTEVELSVPGHIAYNNRPKSIAKGPREEGIRFTEKAK